MKLTLSKPIAMPGREAFTLEALNKSSPPLVLCIEGLLKVQQEKDLLVLHPMAPDWAPADAHPYFTAMQQRFPDNVNMSGNCLVLGLMSVPRMFEFGVELDGHIYTHIEFS